jgi:glycosyltransferase involved in cell wall biosynthesis
LFQPAPSAKRYDLVYIGRLSAEKNLAALFHAVKALGLSIAVVGGRNLSMQSPAQDDDEEANLKQEFGALDGRIHWLGRLKNEELPAIMNQSRAFVLCSFIEGQPRVLIEAMACGMPIIASNVPGNSSVIEHNKTGYLCETDAESIAAAIRTVLSKPELMRELGANARQYALKYYAFEQQARHEYELLCDVAQRFPVRSAAVRLAEYLLRRNPPFDLSAASAPN